jgi:hypothetical protein
MQSAHRFRSLGAKENFLGLERRISSFNSSAIVVLPVPYEHTVSYGGGTARGPRAILNASRYVEHYDEELGSELCESVGVSTVPSLTFGRIADGRAIRKIYDAVKELIAQKKFVVVLGGEHTVSQAPIRAHYEKYPDLSVLHFDAHSDLRDTYEGSPYSHAPRPHGSQTILQAGELRVHFYKAEVFSRNFLRFSLTFSQNLEIAAAEWPLSAVLGCSTMACYWRTIERFSNPSNTPGARE